MKIRIRDTAQVLSEYAFRLSRPEVSWPNTLNEETLDLFGADFVLPTEPPVAGREQSVEELAPVQNSEGQWVQTWQLRNWTAEEIQAADLQLQAIITDSVQQRLDDFARTRKYDGILSACSYATGTNPVFQAEGQYCVTAREDTWAALYAIDADVKAGNWPTVGAGQKPASYADIEPQLPVLAWPA